MAVASCAEQGCVFGNEKRGCGIVTDPVVAAWGSSGLVPELASGPGAKAAHRLVRSPINTKCWFTINNPDKKIATKNVTVAGLFLRVLLVVAVVALMTNALFLTCAAGALELGITRANLKKRQFTTTYCPRPPKFRPS